MLGNRTGCLAALFGQGNFSICWNSCPLPVDYLREWKPGMKYQLVFSSPFKKIQQIAAYSVRERSFTSGILPILDCGLELSLVLVLLECTLQNTLHYKGRHESCALAQSCSCPFSLIGNSYKLTSPRTQLKTVIFREKVFNVPIQREQGMNGSVSVNINWKDNSWSKYFPPQFISLV